MRFRVSLLNVLVIAPVAAMLAAVAGPATHARADAAPPQPIVIAIDPGHGGKPSATDPSQPFDPGAIGVNGVLEKDVALDVSKRLAVLLREDMVQVAMTRSTDIPMSVPQREQVAIQSNAALFVSVHCNWFRDPSVGGSLVLFPNDHGYPLAQALSDALGRDLGPAGIADDGTQLRNNWWIHAPMPTATVEMAYLSNPREAGLLATSDFREQVAVAIRDGMERFDPAILARKQELLAWQRAHPTASPPSTQPAQPARPATVHRVEQSSGVATVVLWVVLVGALAALVRWRRPVLHALAVAAATWLTIVETHSLRHASARRRRRRVRARAHMHAHRLAPRSVYDDLSF